MSHMHFVHIHLLRAWLCRAERTVCGAMPARGVEMCDVGMLIGRSFSLCG
jgi:hypothetical protein